MSDEKYVITSDSNVELPKDLSYTKFILNSLKTAGNRIALVDGITNRTIMYNEILQKSVNLAISLKRLGLRKFDVVSISSENRFEFIITTYAVLYLGAVVVPLNIAYTIEEMNHVLNLSKPRFIFCSPLTAYRVKQVSNKLDYVEKILLYGNELIINATLYNELIKLNEDIDEFQPTAVDPVNDHLVILTSSGTTGLPKGVMLTHKNVLLCAYQLKRRMEARNLKEDDTTIFSLMPWYHAFGFFTCINLVAIHFKLVFATRFEKNLFLKILQDHRINVALMVPPLVLFLAKHSLVSQYNLSSLREIWCGAAPLSKNLQNYVTKKLNLRCITQGYGMTETTLAVLRDQSNGAKVGSVGQVTTGTQVKVVDTTTGKALGPYKTGELCFKGPLIMKGYVGDAASTENAFDEKGWLRTGDIGYYDEDKYFYIVDRIKELIKYKGYQVPPAELEAIMLQHGGVSDVGVVGLPDKAAGEIPVAFIVRQPNNIVTEAELLNFVAERVSHEKRLRGGIIFIDQIPRNPAGKILRRELKKLLQNKKSSKL